MITKFKPFDPSSGADRMHASATCIDERGLVIGACEVAVPLTTVYRLGLHSTEKLKQWEELMRQLAQLIANEARS